MNALVWRTWKVKIARELRVRGSAVIDAVLYALHVPPSIPATAKVDNALFYVAELLMARAGRMAKWVTRQSGRKVVLFCHREGYIPEFAGEGFAAVLLYRNAWHLRRLLRTMPTPWIVHGFAPKSHYPDVARRTLPNVPYIHDLQDTPGSLLRHHTHQALAPCRAPARTCLHGRSRRRDRAQSRARRRIPSLRHTSPHPTAHPLLPTLLR
ncbi:MAG: hypothetical protein IPH60_17500 [Flavobacteriales bacterium]|nr:hypothetical protein [Flavobacteriales bacterium]